MRHVLTVCTLAAWGAFTAAEVVGQPNGALAPAPRPVTMAQMKSVDALDGQLVQLTALVRHTDTAQVFTFGGKSGQEFHAIIPNPATDAAHVGDAVAVTGFVRRFNADDFERDYRWFRKADYPDVKSGDWVIVATSVRTSEGTELVPPMTISNTPAPTGKTK